ncbi:MAG: hypothetical protein HFI33_13290 [Lachnospiraceae bacterium]|nr:hypothetical protein [Lachnospiraceae bacterium]
MEERIVLRFELLGAFAGREMEGGQTKNMVVPDKLGKKALSFLQYFIVNHGRNISSEELIEQFWPDTNSSDPANALKNMLFKTRNLLKTLFPGQETLIRTLQGCYGWDTGVTIETDAEEFEQICLEVRRKWGEDYLEALLKAASLYKGDFLPGNDSGWAVSLRRYYQTLYLDVCKMVLPLLQEEERWTEVIGLCEQASVVDVSADTFVTYQMQALIAMGQPEGAVRAYEAFRERLWEEFEIEPTEQVEQIYMLAEGMCQNHMDGRDILKLVAEGELDSRAFLCTFGVFQSIVALERRHLARSGGSSALLHVSLGNKVTPTTDARRLERILLEGLRTGDPVARLDAGSYIFMLAGVSTENARLVMERLERAFHKAYSHSRACISFRIIALQADTAKA